MGACAAVVDTVACMGTKASPMGREKRTTDGQRQTGSGRETERKEQNGGSL